MRYAAFLLFLTPFILQGQVYNWVTGPDENVSVEYLTGIALDSSKNVLVTGTFSDTIDLDPGSGQYIAQPVFGEGVFIQKYNEQGGLIWTRTISSTDYEASTDIEVVNDQYIYLTGYFSDTIDLDPGPGIDIAISNNSNTTSYIIQLDMNGNYLWGTSFYCTDGFVIEDLEADSQGNLVFGGHFGGTADLNPGASAFNVSSAGFADGFIAKMDNNHNFVWGHSFGGSNRDNLDGIAIDQNDDIISTGLYQSSNADFDPGAGVANLSYIDESDVFVQKLDAQGNFLWVKAACGDDFQEAYSIDTDALNNIYVVGFAAFEIAYDYPNNTVLNPVTGSRDGFLWKLNPNGNTSWFKQLEGDYNDNVYDVYVANDDQVFVAGAGSDSLNYSDNQNPVYFDDNSTGFIAEYDTTGNFQFRYELSQSYSAVKQVIARDDEVFAAGEFSSTVDFDWSVSQVNDLSAYYILDYFILNIGPTPPTSQTEPWSTEAGNNFSVYPNPVTGGSELTIHGDNFDRFELMDVQGNSLVVTEQNTIPTADLKAGIYLLRAFSADVSKVVRVVVQ